MSAKSYAFPTGIIICLINVFNRYFQCNLFWNIEYDLCRDFQEAACVLLSKRERKVGTITSREIVYFKVAFNITSHAYFTHGE